MLHCYNYSVAQTDYWRVAVNMGKGCHSNSEGNMHNRSEEQKCQANSTLYFCVCIYVKISVLLCVYIYIYIYVMISVLLSAYVCHDFCTSVCVYVMISVLRCAYVCHDFCTSVCVYMSWFLYFCVHMYVMISVLLCVYIYVMHWWCGASCPRMSGWHIRDKL